VEGRYIAGLDMMELFSLAFSIGISFFEFLALLEPKT
jgi:hypothetical protein